MPELPIPIETLLDALTKDELVAAIEQMELEVAERRSKAPLADALASLSHDDLANVFDALGRERLKELCRKFKLDDSGRDKKSLIDRLLPAPKASDATPAKPTRKPSQPPVSVAPTSGKTFESFREIADFLWQNAERLRGAYKPNEYDKVILPLLVVRRLDCVLEPSKEKVLARLADLVAKGMKASDPAVDIALRKAAGVPFYNTSKLDFAKLKGDPNHIAQNLRSYLKAFSANARDIIEQFKFDEQITRLDDSNLLFQVLGLFAEVNLHPDQVPNHMMGSVFEELIRRFNEKKNEEAGDHYTPREIIRLMVDLLFVEDDDALRKPGVVRTLFDPACGTGGMLSVAEEYLLELNPQSRLEVYGQELNPESYAICKSDMIIKGQNPENIIRGNSFSEDGHGGRRFDYLLSNPPFGIDWKNVQKVVEDEHEKQGFAGRFGAGTPRINDGALLFLQHMLSKMKPIDSKTGDGGSRMAIVLNGSPLFTGDITVERPLRLNFQASAERLARLEEEKAFANLATSKKKGLAAEAEITAGKTLQKQLLSALRTLNADHLYKNRAEFESALEATLEAASLNVPAPLLKAILSALSERDETADICTDSKGRPEPDSDLRDNENVPLKEDVASYFEREVAPHVPDAWVAGIELKKGKAVVTDESKVRVGYEIPITRHFYKYKPLRELSVIEAEIRQLEGEIQGLLGEVLQ